MRPYGLAAGAIADRFCEMKSNPAVTLVLLGYASGASV